MSQSPCLSVGAGILWWGRRKVTPPEQHVSLAEGCQSAGFPLLPDLTPLSVESPAVGAEEASTQVSIYLFFLPPPCGCFNLVKNKQHTHKHALITA